MNYTEMLFNRDERLVNLLNQADSKNLELIEEINKKDKEIDRLNKEYERIYNENCKLREEHNITDIKLLDENNRLNNIINELENTIENFMENHTEGYLDWKYDREIYLAESNVLQKLCDTYFDKLKELGWK